MRRNCSRLGLALSFFLAALASEAARAQTDVALSLYGTFNSTNNYDVDLSQSAAKALGGLFEFRHISNPFMGFEATYSFNRANQVYNGPIPVIPVGIPSGPGPYPAAVSANAHEITGDWVFSVHAGGLRPFALVGIGLLLTEPVSGQSKTTSSNEPVYVYGAGLDWRIIPHLGLRFQYRGNVHKAADISTAFGSSNAFTHTAEPMIGAYIKF